LERGHNSTNPNTMDNRQEESYATMDTAEPSSVTLHDEAEQRLRNDLDALRELACGSQSDTGSDSDVTGIPIHWVGTAATTTVEPDVSGLTLEPCEFQMGDHVYRWCSFALIPAVFQHHGIVTNVYWQDNNPEATAVSSDSTKEQTRRGEWMMTIADFFNSSAPSLDDTMVATKENKSARDDSLQSFHKSSKRLVNGPKNGVFRTYQVPCSSPTEQWHKVVYQASWFQRHVRRSGTCTAVASDPPGLMRARVQFLQDRGATILPPYHAVSANCECVAVWCKTGTWATLQAINFLALTAAGQTKSAVMVASAAAAQQVTVPAAGLWGWLGYTTHVSLVSTQPYLLPAIAAYGVVTAGAPALWLLQAKRQGKQVTTELNTAFWKQAMDYPDPFVECLIRWSALHEPSHEEWTVLSPVGDQNVAFAQETGADEQMIYSSQSNSGEAGKDKPQEPEGSSASTRIPVPL
jgi:hypothetical protein